jgi:hypothetical protein
MESLIPFIANILAPTVLDFLFGSGAKLKLAKKGGCADFFQGHLALIGYPTLEKSLEYLIANNFPDLYKTIVEKRKELENSESSKKESSDEKADDMTFYGYGYHRRPPRSVGMGEVEHKRRANP